MRAALFVLATLMLGAAHAAPIVHEGFSALDYADGTQIVTGLDDQRNSPVYDGAWANQRGGLSDADIIQGASLAFTHGSGASLATEGFAVTMRTDTETASRNDRNLVDLAHDAANPLWIGFLLRYDTLAVTDSAFLNLVGLAGELAIGGFGGNLSLMGTDGTTVESTVAVQQNRTYFLVTRLTSDALGETTADLFIDPAPGAAMPGSAPAATLDALEFDAFVFGDLDRFQLAALGHSGTESFRMDEIRIGRTYGDVAPIPEPGAALSLALAGLALGARRLRGG